MDVKTFLKHTQCTVQNHDDVFKEQYSSGWKWGILIVKTFTPLVEEEILDLVSFLNIISYER